MHLMKQNSKMDGNDGSDLNERLKMLYPNVTEALPLFWSSTEKNNSIGLSNSNLRVHYKGKAGNDFHFFSNCLDLSR